MEQVIEGTWEEVSQHGAELQGKQVRVTILPDRDQREAGQMLFFGMFKGERESTEEDFKSAEFHGDPDDGMDWT